MARVNPVSDFVGKAAGVLVFGFLATVYIINKQERRAQMDDATPPPLIATGSVGTLHPPRQKEARLCEAKADGAFAAPCASYGAYVWENTPAELVRIGAAGGELMCRYELRGSEKRTGDAPCSWFQVER
ncbi:MAG: hypothetical protein HOO96_06675 [Polyangiaceae bacterium]|nr:hypothetical protein [Polyangiaceae bacterium]